MHIAAYIVEREAIRLLRIAGFRAPSEVYHAVDHTLSPADMRLTVEQVSDRLRHEFGIGLVA